jgi:hypothetical protein
LGDRRSLAGAFGAPAPAGTEIVSSTLAISTQSQKAKSGKKRMPNSCTTPARIPNQPNQRGITAVRRTSADAAQMTRASFVA